MPLVSMVERGKASPAHSRLPLDMQTPVLATYCIHRSITLHNAYPNHVGTPTERPSEHRDGHFEEYLAADIEQLSDCMLATSSGLEAV